MGIGGRVVRRLQSPAPALPGETVVGSWPANHTRRGVAVGGTLWLTDRQILFVPNRVEARSGRARWACPLAEIVDVGIAGRGWHPAAWRRRLRVRTSQGTELLLVPHVARVAAAVAQVAGRPVS